MEYIELADDRHSAAPKVYGVDYIQTNGHVFVSSITCWVLGLEKRIALNTIMCDDAKEDAAGAVREMMETETHGKVEIDAGALW